MSVKQCPKCKSEDTYVKRWIKSLIDGVERPYIRCWNCNWKGTVR